MRDRLPEKTQAGHLAGSRHARVCRAAAEPARGLGWFVVSTRGAGWINWREERFVCGRAIDCGSSAFNGHSAFQIIKKVLQKGDVDRAFLLARTLARTKYREALAVRRQIQTPDNRAGRRVIDAVSRP